MKVLVVRLSSFGDQIHVCPAVADLKRQRPGVEIHWLVQSEFAAVPQAHRAVSKVFGLQLTALKEHPFSFTRWRSLFNTIRDIRREHYDLVIDVHGMIKSACMALMSGARVRVGYGRKSLAEGLSSLAYHRHFRHTPGMTSVNKLRDFFRWTFDLESLDDNIDFGLTIADSAAENTGVLFVPFASHPSKMLSMDCWVELALALRAQHPTLNMRISWGTEHEHELARRLQQQSQEILQPNPRRFDSSELIDFLQKYRLVVGMDSGITQLANALGVPTVMVFTASAPRYFFTPGAPSSFALGGTGAAPTAAELIGRVSNLLNASERLSG